MRVAWALVLVAAGEGCVALQARGVASPCARGRAACAGVWGIAWASHRCGREARHGFARAAREARHGGRARQAENAELRAWLRRATAVVDALTGALAGTCAVLADELARARGVDPPRAALRNSVFAKSSSTESCFCEIRLN